MGAARKLDEGLFPSEAVIARRLSQTPADWKARAVLLERQGLPRIDPMMGGRYWPAVLAWFNKRHGIASLGPSSQDGTENYDALR